MQVEAQLTGLHSRSETLVNLTRAYDRGREKWGRVDNQIKLETAQLLDLQARLGFDVLTDGALDWQDPLRPLTISLKGVTSGAMYSRWFDTNTFYKKPMITDRIELGGFEIGRFVQKNIAPGVRKWKVSIPGPFTFSDLSENEFYDDPYEFLRDIALAERQIIEGLVASGVSSIQLSEPSLVYRPYRASAVTRDEVDSAIRAIRTVSEGNESTITIHTFFGDPGPVLTDLLNLPVAGVGIDLYETQLYEAQAKPHVKVTLGIVDSRESHIEESKWIAETARRVGRSLKAQRLVLAPNTDLRYVPREIADSKIGALAEAVKILREDWN